MSRFLGCAEKNPSSKNRAHECYAHGQYSVGVDVIQVLQLICNHFLFGGKTGIMPIVFQNDLISHKLVLIR